MGIINNILTKFTTAGANQVAQATTQVARAQTRLGHASVSAGRQFAAQSAGLGGLVGAYAGAAATSFALEAAFTGLSNSARALQTFDGLNTLAANAGIAGKALMESVHQITNGQMTLVEAAQNINLSLSAGFNTSQIEGLADVAMRASRALGRDLTDAYVRVVRGSAKMETELLDELGIYTKIEPATRAYALSLGVATSSLSEFQRRQAFVNAVISEGQRKYSMINTAIPTTAEVIEKFIASMSTALTSIGGVIANMLVPVIEFLNSNLGAAFGALGLALAMALAKGFSAAGDAIRGFENNIERRVTSLQQRILASTSAPVRAAYDAARTALQAVRTTGGGTAGGVGKSLIALRDLATAQELNNKQLRDAEILLKQRSTNLTDNIAADTKALAAEQARLAVLTAGTVEYKKAADAVDKYNKRIINSNAALTLTATQIQTVNTALTMHGSALISFSGSLLRMSLTAGAALSRLALGAVSVVSNLLMVGSLFGIIGSGVASLTGNSEEFSAFTAKVTQAVSTFLGGIGKKQRKSIFEGLVLGALEDLEDLDAGLRNTDSFTFTKKFLGIDIEITKTKEDIIREVASIMADVSNSDTWSQSGRVISSVITASVTAGLTGLAAGAGTPLGWGAAVGLGLIAGIATYMATEGPIAIEDVSEDIVARFSGSLEGYSAVSRDNALRALETVNRQYAAAAEVDPAAASILRASEQLIVASAEYSDNLAMISSLISATGQTAAQLSDNYDFSQSGIATTVVAGITFDIRVNNLDEARISLSNALDRLTTQTFYSRISEEDTESLLGLNFAEIREQIAELGTTDALNNFRDSLTTRIPEESIGLLEEYIARIYASVTATSSLDDMMSSLATTVGQYQHNFDAAVTAVESLGNTSLRALEIVRNLQSGIDSNTLDLERFDQEMSNINSTVAELGRLNLQVTTSINALEALPQNEGVDRAIEALRIQLELIQAQRDGILSIIEAQVAYRDALQATTQLHAALASITGTDANNPFLQSIEEMTAISGDRFGSTLSFLNQVISQTREAGLAQEALRNELTAVGFTAAQVSATISAGTDSQITSLVQSLQGQDNTALTSYDESTRMLTTTVNGATTSVRLLDTETLRLADSYGRATDATRELMEAQTIEVLGQMRQQMASLADTAEAAARTIDELTIREFVLSAQFELDLLSIDNQIARLQAEMDLEHLQLQVDLVNAQVGSGAITPMQGTNQENALQQNILDQRRALLDLELAQSLAEIEARRKISLEESYATIAEIEAKRDMQIAEIENANNIINSYASLYDGYLSNQTEVNNSLIAGFTTAGSNVANGIIQALNAGGSALNASINAAFTGGGASAAGAITIDAPEAAVAPTNLLTEALTAYNEQTAVTIEAIRARAVVEIQAAELATQRELTLADREALLARANHAAAVRNLGVERQIESNNAQQRINDINEAGGAAEEVVDRLKGRLAEMQGSFESTISSALMGLNDLLFYGEGTIEEVVGNFFKSIQRTVFEKTIAEPIANWLSQRLTSWINDAVGGVDIMGNPLMNDVGRDAEGVQIPVDNSGLVTSSAQNASTAISTATTTLSTAIQNLGSTVLSSANTAAGNAASGQTGLGGLPSGAVGNTGMVAASAQGATAAVGTATASLSGSLQRLGSSIMGSATTATGTVTGASATASTGIATGGQTMATSLATTGTTIGATATAASSTMLSSLLMLLPILLLLGLFMRKKGSSSSAPPPSSVTITDVPRPISSTPQLAAGGWARFAAGGRNLRDNVPALLEEGEFVVRRPAAQKIGASALSRMNATGKASGGEAPTINFKNEGSPKTMETGDVKFDGDKFVIDVIIRDLENNGPIRRSLRGGKV